MIVQCVGCKARLRVDELKIPAEGGLKMRCPKCKVLFRVKKPASTGGVAHVSHETASAPASNAGRMTAVFGGGAQDEVATPKRAGTMLFGDSAKERAATNIWGGNQQEASSRGTAIFGASDVEKLGQSSLASEGGAAVSGGDGAESKSYGGGTAIFGGVPYLSDAPGESVESNPDESASASNDGSLKKSPKTEIFGASGFFGDEADGSEMSSVSNAGDLSQQSDTLETKSSSDAASLASAMASSASSPSGTFSPSSTSATATDTEEVDDKLLGDFPLDEPSEDTSSGDEKAPPIDVPSTSQSCVQKPEASETTHMPLGSDGDAGVEVGVDSGVLLEGLLSSSNSQRERTILRKKRQARNKLVVIACLLVALAIGVVVILQTPVLRAQVVFLWNQIYSSVGGGCHAEVFSLHKQRWSLAKTASGKGLMVFSADVRNNSDVPQKPRWVQITMVKGGAKVASSLGVMGVQLAGEDLFYLRREADLRVLLRKKMSNAPKEIRPGELVPMTVVFFADQEAISDATMTFDWDASGK